MQQPRDLPEIYVVNLPSSRKRRDTMKLRLQDLGLEYTLIEAFDARNLTDEQRAELVSEGLVHPTTRCSPGAIGCAISHLSVYRRMVTDSVSHAIILEDDVLLDPSLPAIAKELPRVMRDDEVVLLFYLNEYRRGPSRVLRLPWAGSVALTERHHLFLPKPAKLHSTAGYALTLPTAKRLLSNCTPVRFPPDVWTIWKNERAIDSIRVVHPMPVIEEGGPSERQQVVLNSASQRTSLHRRTLKLQLFRQLLVPLLLRYRRWRGTLALRVRK